MATSVPGVVPVPESTMVRFGFEAFEVTVRLPLAAPLALGLKVTVNEVLWPAERVRGKDRPLRLNPAPVAVAAEIVRLDPPELVSVSDRLEFPPVCTVPNTRLAGLGVRVPAVTPVPDSGILRLGFDPLEVTLIEPVAAPLVVGAKRTLNEALWPAGRVRGRERPLRVNPDPVAAAAEMVMDDPPEFVSVPASDFELPT